MGFPNPFMMALRPLPSLAIDAILGVCDLGLIWLGWRLLPVRLGFRRAALIVILWLATSRAAMELQLYIAPWAWDHLH
jgi:hypothetical protein